MPSSVPRQAAFCTEPPAAKVTGERPLPGVRPDVFSECALVDAPLTTVITAKRPLA